MGMMREKQTMIQAKNLTKIYSGVTVLNIPDLRINRGERFGLVGNNGAGKTTFFSLVLDLIRPNSGEVISGDRSVFQSDHWKSYTGSYLDESFLIEFLTPEEYFDFIVGLDGKQEGGVRKAVEPYEDFFNGEVLGKKKLVRELSRGNQKKVGLVAALMTNPDVIVLDEPFPHLDPTSVIRLKKMLKDLAARREVTMLISSHDLNHVTDVCDRIALLEKGVILRDIKTTSGTMRELESYFAAQLEQ
jgi:ABC-2 type transport system ATP-binding protein